MKSQSALSLCFGLLTLAALACSFGQQPNIAPTPKPGQSQTCKWTGTWNTEWGGVSNGTALLVLNQKGKTVTGDYTYAGVDVEVNGQIEGTVDEMLLTGTWVEGSNDGTLTFDLDEKCNAFAGEWARDTGEGGNWDGTRVKFTEPEPTVEVVESVPDKAIQTALSAHQGIYVNADGYQVLEAKPLAVPDTSENDGIAEAWCVAIYYTWTSSDEAGFVYTEASTRAYVVVHRNVTGNKAWTARSTDLYGCEGYDELR